MAQRQFLDSDTDKWTYRYGNAGGGNVSASTATDAPVDSAFTGTSGATTGVATNASFAAGQIVVIDQTQGTNANADPSWELNKIQSYTTGAPVFYRPLTRNYTTGAQIVVVDQLRDFNLNGATLTAKAWNGTVGGLLVRMGTGRFYGTGTITLAGKGFRGAAGRGANGVGNTGEGHPGASVGSSASTNGNGGAGGANNNHAAAGGGNGTAGSASSNGDPGGLVAGNAALTIFSMGGGGGSGSNQSGNGASGVGGIGGAKLLVIFPRIDVSSMTINLGGTNGATSTGSDGSPGPGGGGAGGSALFKGAYMVFGSNTVTALGGSGASGGGNTSGGGGNGRIHADIPKTANLSGTTNPTIDVSNHKCLQRLGGATVLFNLL